MFTCIHHKATLPVRGTKQSAGYDFSALKGGVVYAGSRLCIETGIRWSSHSKEALAGHWGLLKERSSHANAFGLTVLAGVIDADYQGEIKVILLNTGKMDFRFKAGDRIAQMIVMPYVNVSNEGVLSEERTGGFGSTNPCSETVLTENFSEGHYFSNEYSVLKNKTHN